jgi:hypothetical protein
MTIRLRYKILIATLSVTSFAIILVLGVSRWWLLQQSGLLSNFFDAVALIYYGIPTLIGLLILLIVTRLLFRVNLIDQKEHVVGYLLSILLLLILFVSFVSIT